MKMNPQCSEEERPGMTERPTKVRRRVLFVVCLVYFITYLDRNTVQVAAPMMMKHFQINKLQFGLVLSVFSWTYGIFQIPVGMLGDKFGPRKVLAALVSVWSLFTAATALAWNFASLVVIRALFGLGESGAFATATRAFASWIPSSERGFAQGVTHAAARFGATATPIIVAAIMVRWGWQAPFLILGVLGLAWSAFWYFWYRDKPTEFKERWGAINQAEMDFIEGGRSAKKAAAKLQFRTLLKSRNLWFLSLSYPAYCYVSWIYAWFPLYLVEARGFTIIKMGIFLTVIHAAGPVGNALGGWLSDEILRKTGNSKFARRVVAMAALLMAAGFIIPAALTNSAYMAVFFLTGAVFCLETSVAVYWAVCLDVGHEYAGTVSAMMNSVGQVGSVLSPLVFGAILQFTGSWVYPFIVAGVVLVAGVFLWLGVNPELSLVDELGLRQAKNETTTALA
jgi:sugar phosphate permease